MPLISNMTVTFVEQRRDVLNYESDVPGRRGCTRTVLATPPRHVGPCGYQLCRQSPRVS